MLASLAGSVLSFTGAGAANAQPIAAESYIYAPPGNPLDSYPASGLGFNGTWYEQFGHWTVEAGSLSYSDGTHTLQTSGNRVRTSNAEARRNLAQAPLGNSPGTIWVSMLAHQSGGVATNSFGGLSLPTGPGTFLFFGKPYNRTHWGFHGGPGTTIRDSTVPATQPAFLVMRIDTREGADDVYLWVNPPTLAAPPSTGSADVVALNYNNFENINILLLEAGATNANITMDVDEIRIGDTFADVAPISESTIETPFAATGTFDLVLEGNVTIDTSEGPPGSLVLAGAGVLHDDGSPVGALPYRVLQYRNITVLPGASVRVVGDYPLIWVADGSVQIDGEILASAQDAPSSFERNGGRIDPGSGAVVGPGGAGGGGGGGSVAIFAQSIFVGPSGVIDVQGGRPGLPGLFAPLTCAGNIDCYLANGFVPGLGIGGEGGRGGPGAADGGDGGTSFAGGNGGNGGNGRSSGLTHLRRGNGGAGGGGGAYAGQPGTGGTGRNAGLPGAAGSVGSCPATGAGGSGGSGGGCGGSGGAGGSSNGASGSPGSAGACSDTRGGGGGGGGGGATSGGHGGNGGPGTTRSGGGGGGGGGDSCYANIPPGNAGLGGAGGSDHGGAASNGNPGSYIPYVPPCRWCWYSFAEGGPGGGGQIMLAASSGAVVVEGRLDARGGLGHHYTSSGGLGNLHVLGSTISGSGTILAQTEFHLSGIANAHFSLDGGRGGGGGGGAGWSFVLCPADVDDGTGSGTPDGGVTIDDLLHYLNIFEAGDIRADVDDGTSSGTPDQGVTIDDLLYFLQRFEAGC